MNDLVKLTHKEKEIAKAILENASVYQINKVLQISLSTLNTHCKSIRKKLNTTKTLEAIQILHNMGLLK